jgi:hypothetical protein
MEWLNKYRWVFFSLFVYGGGAWLGLAADPPFRVRTLLGGEYWWCPPTAEYLDYLGEVRPDLVHGGVLGPELASCLDLPGIRKAITPICPSNAATMREAIDWWKAYVAQIHRRGIKVQATISLVNVWGDADQQTGWFDYYNRHWETDLLGVRPSDRAESLLEIEPVGQLGRNDGQAGWYRYRGCINNPAWRETLKAFVRTGIDAGFDGFMVQFSHARGSCVCAHCQRKFRDFIAMRHGAELGRLGIADLSNTVFTFTAPRPGRTEPIDLAAREFTEECVAEVFADVFLGYGRSLKPDLIVSKWFHFRQFITQDSTNINFAAYMDERAMMPANRWCTGEDYVWYSSPMYRSNLKAGIVGDSALDGRYLRAMCGDTPFEVLKYDYFRWRLTVGEAIAQGGIAFGTWKGGWSGGQDRETPHLKTYFKFIRDNDRFLYPRQSHAEVGLLYPRESLKQGDAAFFEPLRRMGRALIEGQILFDLIIDQKMTRDELARHRVILIPDATHLTVSQIALLQEYKGGGGRILEVPNADPGGGTNGWPIYRGDLKDGKMVRSALTNLLGEGFSTFDVPWTVQVYADRQIAEKRLLIHLVNFNRDESREGFESPLAAAPAGINLSLPDGFKVRRVLFYTPEASRQKLRFKSSGNRLQFTAPSWLVYGLCVIEG